MFHFPFDNSSLRSSPPQRGDRPHAGDGEFFKGDEAGGFLAQAGAS